MPLPPLARLIDRIMIQLERVVATLDKLSIEAVRGANETKELKRQLNALEHRIDLLDHRRP